MEETTKDFFDQQKEKDLLARTGRTRPMSKPSMPTRKEWEAQNGPVITKKLPDLPRLTDRIRYMQARQDLTGKELAKKAGIAVGTLYRILSGAKTTESTLWKIANALDAPPDWLMGTAQTPAETTQRPRGQTPHPKQKNQFEACCNTLFRFELAANGEYSGEELRELLGCLVEKMRYSVKINIRAETPK